MLLGEILIKKGIITEDQLELALKEQARTGALLGEVLNSLGFVSQEVITEILAQEAGVECLKLKECTISDEAIKLVPEAFARRHKVLPILLDNGTLKVAMSNIFDVAVIDELQELTKYYVEAVAATEADISDAINRCYGAEGVAVQEATIIEEEGKPIDTLIEENIRLAEIQTKTGEEQTDVTVVAPVIKLIDLLLTYAVIQDATDLHIEPDEKLIRTRYRIDGVLLQGPSLPKLLLSPLTVRV
ncbi:MAG: GspE/PulE family protein, partial [Candidatus Brocadiales bacterium]